MRHMWSGLGICLCLAAAASVAVAQDTSTVERKGLVAGAVLGVGQYTYFGDARSSIGFEIDAGVMLGQRVAALLGVSESVSGTYDYTVLYSGAVQYWPTQKYWVKLGAGKVRGCEEWQGSAFCADGTGFMMGGGKELLQRKHLALDLSVRVVVASLKSNMEKSAFVGIGVRWF